MSPVICGRFHCLSYPWSASWAIRSVDSQRSPFRFDVWSISGLTRSRTASVVSATVAPASAAIAWMREGVRFARGG